jgi:hypothetical protein
VSQVANVMLSVAGDDTPTADQFAAWILTECPREHAPQVRGGVGTLADITSVDDNRWGGYKMPECTVYAGALNHAHLGALLERFGATEWRVPAAVQLFVMDQEDAFFRLWMIRDGRLQQYAPLSPDEDDDGFWPPDDEQFS